MPTEGTEVMAALKADLDAASGDLADCQEASSKLDAHMKELLEKRGEGLLKLASMFLPEISKPAIEKTFDGIRSDLLMILARKEAHQRELKNKLDAADTEAKQRTGELEEVTHRLNEKVAQREALEAKVAETLKGNSEFQERSKLALQAEENLHRNEQRVGDIEKDAAEKLPNYEKSRLFLYLYDRKFGTLEYKGGEWTRAIDGWVAKMIDYNNAKNGYEYLKKTPKLVGEEVAKRRDQFNALMQQVETIQRAEADKAGLTEVLREGDALGDERDRLVQVIEQLRKQAEDFQKGLAQLATTQNQFYKEAIERFRGFLGETKLALLQKRAKETPEPDDDAVVADLASLETEIQNVQPKLAEIDERRQTAERLQQGLDLVVRRYRKANFDSQRSFFPQNFHVRMLADRFRSGRLDADTFWDEIRSAQQFRPHWVESSVAGGTEVLTSPAGRVLIGAILNAANGAMQESASRGVQRRHADMFPSQSFPSFPTSSAPPSYSPPSGGGSDGFTTIDGF